MDNERSDLTSTSTTVSKKPSDSWDGFEKVVWDVKDNILADIDEQTFTQRLRTEEGASSHYALRMKCLLCSYVINTFTLIVNDRLACGTLLTALVIRNSHILKEIINLLSIRL